MADVNSITLTGRLTRDAVVKTLPTGTSLLEFAVANNRGFGDHAKAFFFDCKLWGDRAKSLCSYMTKGTRVGLTGELTIESWESDGVKHNRTVIRVLDVNLMGGNNPKQEEEPEPEVAF